MKPVFKLLVAFALFLVAFGQSTTADAGGALVFHSRGPTAIATFINTSGCIYTETAVTATESQDRNEPGPGEHSSLAAVSISQFNTCTETPLYVAYGDTPLSPGEFQISNTLDWATLNTTIPVFNEISGTTFDVSVNLTWTATGPITRQHGNEHLHTPDCIVNSHAERDQRLAQATGTVVYGGTNFTPEPSVDAILISLKNGTVLIGCF
jgi:hypothetical protein